MTRAGTGGWNNCTAISAARLWPTNVRSALRGRCDTHRSRHAPCIQSTTSAKAAASLLAFGLDKGLAQSRVPQADMHSHLGILSRVSLADGMRSQGVALVA
ncbi:MAG: hypothetical protein ABI330_21720 [Caldimonas sp.]